MSIRNALTAAMLTVALAATAALSVLGIVSVNRSVIREAQARVNHNLHVLRTYYQQRIEMLSARLARCAEDLDAGDPFFSERLRETQRALNFTVLNVCDVRGIPLAGSYPESVVAVPVARDPILRRALEGETTAGTALLDGARLFAEGGDALRQSMLVPSAGGDKSPTESALFWWFAHPLRDEKGRIAAIVYGGKALNYNLELVDEFRELSFGTDRYRNKPLGTVTIFLGPVRVATNVLEPDQSRALGTVVSEEVRRKVLGQGESWGDRAWVVDAWYLSGYDPIRDADGKTVGMLYVGLLEAPYRALRNRLAAQFIVPAAFIAMLAVVAALALVRRITRPLHQLGTAANRMAKGDWNASAGVEHTYAEIEDLSAAFQRMQSAIAERDRELHARNAELAETNSRLERANRNYMETLGFVTHELKSPLAAMQSTMDLILGGYVGDASDETKDALLRAKRQCETLQDMVKNYLDLSRAERGELIARPRRIDFVKEVVEPSLAETAPLFKSRGIALKTNCPNALAAHADPDLMRGALVNYLSNAAKYGRENGSARLAVAANEEEIRVSVRNDGAGFEEEDRERLFRKFSRLRNESTRAARGSGLGLFLCKRTLELHGGTVGADSKPGEYAEFRFRFPRSAQATRSE